VDLSTGTVVSADPGITDLVIASVGTGWYRVSFSAVPASTLLEVYVSPASGGTISYLGDGVQGVYAWGAQINSGSVRTYYQTVGTVLVDPDSYGFTDASTGLAFTPNGDGTFSINAAPGANAIQLVQLGSGPILFPN